MLSIAQVSGLIAAAVMIIQYTLPAALVVILVRYIGTENNAVTWSVVNRIIGTTVWPHLLRADAVSIRGVPTVPSILNWASTFGAALLVVSSVLAPLGLYEDVVPGDAKLVEFQYIGDPSPWGRVTMPRPNFQFSRRCEYGRRINCPGQYQGVDFVETSPGVFQSVEADESSTINVTIPQNFTTMFTSATSDRGNTVSGLFDIQYRLWKIDRWSPIQKGQPYVVGDFRHIEKLIPQESIILKEGLIIDMREDSGIGFRNHTVPVGLEKGGTWSEDITWMQPVTRCADTNLSIEMRSEFLAEEISDNHTFFVVDRGAFIGLDSSALESRPWLDNQTLDLFGRAHKAARMHNVLVASSLNISLPLDPPTKTLPKVEVQETGEAPPGMYDYQNFDPILLGQLTGVGGPPPEVTGFTMGNTSFSTGNTSLSPGNTSTSEQPSFVPRYPDGIRRLVALNYSAIDQICKGFYALEMNALDWRANNIDNPAVQCGFVLGSPETDTSASTYSSVQTYQRDLHICASSITASIKTVDFRYNATGVDFSRLEVLQIKDKVYPDEESKPLWAVENSYDRRMQFDSLWGVVDRRFEMTDGFDTVRAEKLWFPASPHIAGLGEVGYDALAAVSGILGHLGRVYTESTTGIGNDFSGKWEAALLERFQRLSRDGNKISQIPSLLLTNNLAATLVGTKTSISTRHVEWPASLAVDGTVRGFPRARVITYKRVIRYDVRFAIPGFVVLALSLFALIGASGVFLSSRSIVRIMQNMYNQTSAGRLATNLLRPDQSDPKQPSSDWVKGDGELRLNFGRISSPEHEHFCRVVEGPSGAEPSSGSSSLPAKDANNVLITERSKTDSI